MKIVTVIGARPQFIKAATVSRELTHEGIQEIVIHTGQHFDHNMSQVFFDEMEIRQPDYHLDISGLSHGAMTGRMLEKIEVILQKETPDFVMVYGDTNSTLAGALAAAKLHIPVAHVEAGLRSFDMNMPEEINRILTDRISSILFCPTQTAVSNLEKEGFSHFKAEIVPCGDVMYDAVLFYKDRITSRSTILEKENLTGKPFVLATIHRAENTDNAQRLRQIGDALNDIQKEIQVVVPLHPRTRAHLKASNITLHAKVIDPVGYFDSLALLQNSKLVLTDSGGLQKEAYFFNKHCLTLRDQTEWIELVEAGMNTLVGADSSKILNAFHLHLNRAVGKSKGHLYGEGNASSQIAKYFSHKQK